MTDPLNFKMGAALIGAALMVGLMVLGTNREYYTEKIKDLIHKVWDLKDGDDE